MGIATLQSPLFKLTTAIAIAISLSSTAFAQGPLITIVGSNTVGAALGPACAQGYIKDVLGADNVVIIPSKVDNEFTVAGDNQTEIYFKAHGSSTGFKALKQGQADIAMASRPIKSTEKEALAHLGNMLSPQAEHTVAIDGLALVVHPNNPIKALTTQQLAAIFAGEINNWQQLGGFNAPIDLAARDQNSGTWDTFKSLVLKDKSLADNVKRFESNTQLASYVAQSPSAIGFTSLAATGGNTVLAIAESQTQFIAPDHLSVASEDYLLSRRLFMYTPEQSSNSHTKQFIDYCLSSKGQERVAQTGFVPQKIQTVDFEASDLYPRDYQALANQSKRLSVNFRFSPSSADLDTKAVRDLARLVEYYKTEDGLKISLVGFSDSRRSTNAAKILSKMRAIAVKTALRENGIDVEQILAMGDSIAVADSGSQAAKTKNGRVEVWVRK